jgi:diguanylate cyclase (GGDEF)-like protein
VLDLELGEFALLIARARYHGVQNGAICLARGCADAPWEATDRALAAGVGNHLGIAIAQIADHEALERLSRTDELTGLVNRRAFYDVVASRLNHLRRMKRSGALLYVDLDNFKPVNDVHGHAQGDLVLKNLAELLNDNSRAGDVPARFGGDEFALWLEETDEASAIAKAKGLLSASAELRPFSGSDDKPLGISIGIAISEPTAEPEDLKALIARADEAMYRAKRAGKGGYVLVRSTEWAGTERAASPGESG